MADWAARLPIGASACFTKTVGEVDVTVFAGLTGSRPVPTVSIGYDRVRFVRPVFIGDTRTATYRIVAHQIERTRVVSEVVCVNPHGEKVAAATPVMKVVA